ncbi:replication initiation protein [Paraglaciecola chathamensis]|uniref:replication initiation protein n=1 Tax=Paraglaciecola chathamensis TaxID=368405 RepID=UPI0027024CDE|nr:replication initiation protein [Paraglaciecola chathamensis]MDO6842078.1 replication initiation protein [Paraglaciecola chathamensis]
MNKISVTKSNYLLDASYRLNTQAHKLILCCIAKLDPMKRPEKTITITASQYAELMNIDLKHAYEDLYKSADALFSASIILNEGDEDIELHWIQKKAKKRKGEGQVTLTWSEDVLKYLTQLSGQFKTYQLRHVANLDSSHAIRLYEILVRFEDTGWREISLYDFKKSMGISNIYPQFKELRRRVIDPAIKQINKSSNLKVTVKPKKNGLKIYGLRFDIIVDEQMALDYK